MATTFDWQFSLFEKAPSQGGLIDVVKTIHWRLNAEDSGFSATAYGSAALGDPDPDNFVAYDDITKQWAIDAVSATMDVAALQAALQAEINGKMNPSVVPSPPPFVN